MPKQDQELLVARINANYINGNQTDAKKLAKRISFANLREGLLLLGCSRHVASDRTAYLKGQISFGELCKTEGVKS